MLKRLEEIENILENSFEKFRLSKNEKQMWPNLLQMLGETFECDWGTYWKVEGLSLKSAVIWHAKSMKAPALDLDTQFRTLSLSQGTAGHVWRNRKPVWSTDIAMDMCLPRSQEARIAGLLGGIWFAIKTDRAVYGVVELLSRNLAPGCQELLLAIEKLGLRLGKTMSEEDNSSN